MAELLFFIAGGIALLAMVLAFIRLVIGPHVVDRVIALDGMTIISISLLVFIAYLLQRIIYVDVALVYALVSFIGVVAAARYIERGL